MKPVVAVVLIGLAARLGTWGDEPGRIFLEVYPMDFGDAEAAETVVRAVVGEQGTVTLDEEGHRLLVVTTRAKHEEIAGLIGKLTPPARNVRVDVQFKRRSTGAASGASLGVEGEIVRSEGITHSSVRVKPRVVGRASAETHDVAQTLTVASGREGRIRVGESVPYVEWLVDYGLQHGYVHERVNWQDVGAFLVVQPTVVGDGPMIRIRVTPELSGTVDGRPCHTKFAGVSTEIVAQDGQTFQLGGLDQDREFYTRFLVGYGRGAAAEQLDIFLTPHMAR